MEESCVTVQKKKKRVDLSNFWNLRSLLVQLIISVILHPIYLSCGVLPRCPFSGVFTFLSSAARILMNVVQIQVDCT